MRVRNDSFSQTIIYKSRGKLLARTLAVLLIAALAAQLIHVALAAEAAPGTGSGIAPRMAPDFALRDQAGRAVRLSELRGQVVALAFGAGWCGDCDAATKALLRMRDSMGADALQVVEVSLDSAANTERGTYPVLRDADGEVGRLYAVSRLPSVVLIDQEGRLVASQGGFQPADERTLAAKVRALLAD